MKPWRTLDKPLPAATPLRRADDQAGEIESNMTKEEYFAVVARAKEYIAAGDVFQVVPSQRFRRAFTPAAFFALPGAAPAEPLALSLLSVHAGFCRSSAPARKSWCACATARSPSGPSPAPGRAARPRPKTRRWRKN